MSDQIELCNHGLTCLRLARAATVSSDKKLMFFMAIAWLKLAQQRQEVRSAPDAVEPAENAGAMGVTFAGLGGH